jgi:SCP-2 sterol transfer family
MADATTEFMNALGRRGHDPLLRKVNETIRIDLVSGKKTDRWLVHIEAGDVTVEHKSGAADTVIRADREVFGRLARGEANPVASVLRGDVAWEGAWKNLVAVQRLFPGPPAASHGQPSAKQGRKR